MPGRRAPRPVGLLVDTNVVLDVILMRTPWAPDAARVLDAISSGMAGGFIAGHVVTTVHYIVAKEATRESQHGGGRSLTSAHRRPRRYGRVSASARDEPQRF